MTDPKNVTMKHNKDIIFTALQDALKAIDSLKTSQHNPVADAQAKKNAAVLQSAEVIREVTVGEVVAKLKASIGTILNDVTTGIEAKIEELNVIDQAIALKRTELKEIHGIEVEANTFAAMVNAHQSTKQRLADQHEDKMEEYDAELAKVRAEVAAARLELQKQEQEWKKEFEQTKKRTQSEWDYDFKRSKQQQKDELADELAEERKEHEERIEAADKQLTVREEAVEARELAVDHAEEEITGLKSKVAAFPAELAAATKDAFEKGAKDEQRITAIKIANKENELALKEAGLNAKNESLAAQLEAANKKAAELQEKLDAAYKDIREMGIQMVSSKQTEAAYAKIGGSQQQSK